MIIEKYSSDNKNKIVGKMKKIKGGELKFIVSAKYDNDNNIEMSLSAEIYNENKKIDTSIEVIRIKEYNNPEAGDSNTNDFIEKIKTIEKILDREKDIILQYIRNN